MQNAVGNLSHIEWRTTMAPKAKWTILTYIAAHNNLQQLGDRSLDQIINVGSTDDVIHGVLYDGPQGAARYIAGAPGKVLKQEQLKNFDSGDPVRLVETAKWVFQQYPAERYGLILWSHGTGWRPEDIHAVATQVRGGRGVTEQEASERAAAPGRLSFFRSTVATIMEKDSPSERAILFDDGSGHSLDTLELGRVASQLKDTLGQPLDLLGMDACLMATLEMSYQVRNLVRYYVASEELVPGHSWPYDTIMGKLRAQPDMSAGDLAALVVKDYVGYYTQNPPALNSGDVTKVALDLSRIGDLAGAADCLADALMADMANQAQGLWTAQQECRQQETAKGKRDPSKFSVHQWDLGTLVQRLGEASTDADVKTAAQRVQAALQPGGVVIAEGHQGNWFAGLGGVSAYLMPARKVRISPYYADLAIANETCWLKMLQAYEKAA
jgi:hypothetical protein